MTIVFKAFGIDLTLEDEVDEPSPYDTYNDVSMDRRSLRKLLMIHGFVRWDLEPKMVINMLMMMRI